MATPWISVPTGGVDWEDSVPDITFGSGTGVWDPLNFDLPGVDAFSEWYEGMEGARPSVMFSERGDFGQSQGWNFAFEPGGQVFHDNQNMYLHDLNVGTLSSFLAASGLSESEYEAAGQLGEWNITKDAIADDFSQYLSTFGANEALEYAMLDISELYEQDESDLWSGYSSWEQGRESIFEGDIADIRSGYEEDVLDIESASEKKISDLKSEKIDTMSAIDKAKTAAFEAGKTGLISGTGHRLARSGRPEDLDARIIQDEIQFEEEQLEIDLSAAETKRDYDLWSSANEFFTEQQNKLFGVQSDLMSLKSDFEDESQKVYDDWYSGINTYMVTRASGGWDPEDSVESIWDPWTQNL
tara:strand:- start:3720 stop:4787 length:1068 start_codon:yes stop_codon:yes gene_type:complete